jgi:hypothetical protein
MPARRLEHGLAFQLLTKNPPRETRLINRATREDNTKEGMMANATQTRNRKQDEEETTDETGRKHDNRGRFTASDDDDERSGSNRGSSSRSGASVFGTKTCTEFTMHV